MKSYFLSYANGKCMSRYGLRLLQPVTIYLSISLSCKGKLRRRLPKEIFKVLSDYSQMMSLMIIE